MRFFAVFLVPKLQPGNAQGTCGIRVNKEVDPRLSALIRVQTVLLAEDIAPQGAASSAPPMQSASPLPWCESCSRAWSLSEVEGKSKGVEGGQGEGEVRRKTPAFKIKSYRIYLELLNGLLLYFARLTPIFGMPKSAKTAFFDVKTPLALKTMRQVQRRLRNQRSLAPGGRGTG